jgi:GIY-YIG catalytic domain
LKELLAPIIILHKMDTILDDPTEVKGIIYCVEHIATGKKYVGQTRSHRLNHGRYRPFGAEGRFRSHISEAISNTKHKSGHLLGIDIRQYGKDLFRVSTLEICDVDALDEMERKWITTLNTLHPDGYNLTDGGHIAYNKSSLPVIYNPTPLNEPRKRGGCVSRSAETRIKMSIRTKESLESEEAREKRSQQTTLQHHLGKVARFHGLTIDQMNLDQYIFTKGRRTYVRVGDQEASFTGKDTTQEENIKRAKEFLLSLKS